MNRYTSLAVLALLAVPALAPAGAFADSAPSATARPAGTPGWTKGMSRNVDAHIEKLHSQLQITPAEEAQWAVFAQVMRDNAAQMDAAFSERGEKLQTMNAVQDLQSYAEISQVQSADMQKLAVAFQTLYASFPAPQQKLADEVFRAQKPRPHK